MTQSNYAQDVAFLKDHTKIVELAGPGSAKIAVAPAWQGRVMTSSIGSKGLGASFGWINAPLISTRQNDTVFNNYGGEDRFWLGPEAGQYGLWFTNGQPFDLDHWKTPAGLNDTAFDVTSQGKRSVAMAAEFEVSNYSGATFACAVGRTISVIDQDQVASQLGATVPAGVKMVAFQSRNTLANVGQAAWGKDGGLLSVWILGQFKPLPRGKVIVPFVPGEDNVSMLGRRATTDYFGQIPQERCNVSDECVTFSCDGKFRSKIGVLPARSKGLLGSYDPDGGVLTIVSFNQPAGAHRLPYVNSLWEHQKSPFTGDAINSYNHGSTSPDARPDGFYELESSSPAAELSAGGSITHVHRTYHFIADPAKLQEMALKILGVDLAEIIRG